MDAANQEMYNRHGAAYHAKRGREADSTWNRYLDQPMVEQLLEGLPKGNTADLGCGSGLLTRWLADHGFTPEGADFSAALIAIAREENPDISFAVADIRHTPFASASYDLVTSALVLHYLQDLRPAFAEFARLLKPGGRAVFTMHHPTDEVCHSDPHRADIRLIEPYFNQDAYQFEMAGMHLTAYHHTFENIAEALFENGMVIERIIEARMPESAQSICPQYHKRTNTYPTFVGFRTLLSHDRDRP